MNTTTWVRKTRKRVKCFHCGQYIETGDWQIVCAYYMPVRNRTWWKQMCFHAEPVNCWLERAKAEIEKKPVIETRGRKRAILSDENRVIRGKILRRRASVLQRLKTEMEDGMRPDKIAHLTDQLDKLAVEIEPYGGIPKGW